MDVRQKLFRSALQRVTQRARKNGVVITRADGRRMSSDDESGSAKSRVRVGDGALGADPDDDWLFVDPDAERDDEESTTASDDGASEMGSQSQMGADDHYQSSWER